MKIAINGGKRQISYKMPPRFAFGSNEQKEVEKMVKYSVQGGKIQNFLEFGKKNSQTCFLNIRVAVIQTLLRQ